MYRIMIVEDDEVIARAVQQSLVSWGMDAFCVQDFSSVLAEFAVKNPQLVLMMHLWESDSFIDDNTLTVNVTRLRKKLEEAGLTDFIQTKKGVGYLIA